ncbi:MAG: HEAT repeat domain-containing protein [Planctomycetota bacterium]|jgi:HEAT repeat protein
MRTILILAALFGLVTSSAWAHGGSFRGPNGGVPPGLRQPFDPEPPPPPPTDPGGPGDTTTPRDRPDTNTDPGAATPPGGNPAPPQTDSPVKRKRTNSPTMTFDSWRFWWAYNNDDILNLKSHIHENGLSSATPARFLTRQDENNVKDATLPTRRRVITHIIPALMHSLNRPRDHEDIHGGALVALGKVGAMEHAALFESAAFNRLKTNKGVAVKLGLQATESGVLALGMLPNLKPAEKKEVREICLKIIDDSSLRSRERAWAAVCLGLQRDTEAVKPLVELLNRKYSGEAKRNVPAGILCALGLIGSDEPRTLLETSLEDRKLDARVLAYTAYALGKIGNAESVPLLAKVLKSRSYSRLTLRSVSTALGLCAANGDETTQSVAVKSLKRYMAKSSGDRTGENFATIALSRIGSDEAIRTLLSIIDKGSRTQKPYAALGLGTLAWYRAKEKRPLDSATFNKIREVVARGSEKFGDTETKAAFMITRGLLKDRSAIEECVKIVSRRGDDKLRGPCCVALGLMGREGVTEEVKTALRDALKERRSMDMRRDAAIALGLLRDADTVDLLLDELKRAKSFTVQGQLILAIGTIGDERAIDSLVEILDNTSRPDATRAMAAVGLGMIGDLQSVPRLSRLSKDYNYRASVADLDELLYIL